MVYEATKDTWAGHAMKPVQTAITIRTYEPQDAEAVWALHREGMLETTPEYKHIDAKYEDDLRNIENEYLSPGSNFWVVEAGETLVGMAAIQRLDEQTGRLRRMRVTAPWRRKTIARRLLTTAESFCRAQGYQRIILDTTEQQTAAHRLYERAGFKRTHERTLGPFRVFDYEKALVRSEPVAIRPYETRHSDRVWELHEEGLRDTSTLIGDYRRELHADLAAIEQWYMDAGGHFWVAEVEGTPVGMVGVESAGPATARLRQMRVTRAWRRKGIGQTLLETAERFCRQRGYRRLVLETNALQTAAHHLYERAGFVRTRERTVGAFRVFDYEKVLQ